MLQKEQAGSDSEAVTARRYNQRRLASPPVPLRLVPQLCEGASEEERARLRLRPAQEFRYLNQSGCYELKGVSNAEEYKVGRGWGAAFRAVRCMGCTRSVF